METVAWDVFISHAWEDKDFVRRLADALNHAGLRVWNDVFTLLFDFVRRTGYRKVELLTDRRSVRAIKFYERVGFRFVERESEDVNDVFMEMML